MIAVINEVRIRQLGIVGTPPHSVVSLIPHSFAPYSSSGHSVSRAYRKSVTFDISCSPSPLP